MSRDEIDRQIEMRQHYRAGMRIIDKMSVALGRGGVEEGLVAHAGQLFDKLSDSIGDALCGPYADWINAQMGQGEPAPEEEPEERVWEWSDAPR